MKQWNLKISTDVQKALSKGAPVVALESTIISHGMPYPENETTAREVEVMCFSVGATPATIAIIDGECCVGLSASQLHQLATSKEVIKASRRDIAIAIAQKRTAATTVAATMMIAHQAGIRVFATGGIGGVHRGVAHSWDISADLEELKRTPVHVVCAGVKSILDIPKTLEYLETGGIPAITYQSDKFPAFFSADSGIASPYSMNDTMDLAKMIFVHEQMALQHGSIIANPIDESASIPRESMEEYIEAALEKAKEQQVEGKAITPFLLKEIAEKTGGQSLKSNIYLIKANVRLAARIAQDLAFLEMRGEK
jgi:pseudouridine-5'-phosphate glycosidase